MNSKKFITATLVAFLVVFVFDYIWFGVIFKNWWETTMSGIIKTLPEKPNIPVHALGDLCVAALLAWIYPHGYKGGPAISEGIKFGLLMGLVLELPNAVHSYDAMQSTTLLAFTIVHGIIVGIIGGICVAMVYGSKVNASAAA
jgi:hypothetical protein